MSEMINNMDSDITQQQKSDENNDTQNECDPMTFVETEQYSKKNDIQPRKEQYCGNCGQLGHIYRRCLLPIISLGVILFKKEQNTIKYLMVQRRDTLGYVEFMRGKYNLEI